MSCKVSLIVPVYNSVSTIDRCFSSILAQTLDKVECIVVNDGSTDGSAEKIEIYAEKYPELFKVVHTENSGPSSARNRGILSASGTYIGFVDIDDSIASDFCEKLSLAMESENEIGLVICGRIDVYKNGWSRTILPNENISGYNINQNKKGLCRTSVFVWDKLFRKEIIEKHNLTFQEDIRYGEDALFLAIYKFYCGKIKVLGTPLYYYSAISAASITNSCNSNWLDIIKALENINNFYVEKGRFGYFEKELKELATGFFCRRFGSLHLHKNKFFQMYFVRKFFDFFNKYFENWKAVVENYKSKKPLRYRSSLILASLYIMTPNMAKIFFIKFKRKAGKIFYGRIKYAYYRKFFRIKENRALFVSYFGGSVSCNPYYMAKELAKDGAYEVFIASRNKKLDKLYSSAKNECFKITKVHSNEFVRLLATSKYVVNNSRMPSYVVKREGQVFVNTWHGTPLKTLGAEINTGLSDIGNNQAQFLMCDYLVYPNEYTKNKIMKAFFLNSLYTGKVTSFGYPRNSAFHEGSDKEEIKPGLGLEGKKIFAYMPTWRGTTLRESNSLGHKTEMNEILDRLESELEEGSFLFVKFHQITKSKLDLTKYSKIFEFPEKYETYQFLSAVDVLITDYSSVLFDFANSRKKIVLFIYDYEDYVASRGVYIDPVTLPFQKAHNIDDLVDQLKSTSSIPDGRYEGFLNKYGDKHKDRLIERVNSVIFKEKDADEVAYYNNADKIWKVYFLDISGANFDSETSLKFFLKEKREGGGEFLLVFEQNKVDEHAEGLIKKYEKEIGEYIIMNEAMPMTVMDRLFIEVYRRSGMLGGFAKKAYSKEVQRILPGISFSRLVNKTSNKKLKDIESLFQGKVGSL